MNAEYEELIKKVTNDDNKNYSVAELLDRLMKDDSWEPDPMRRMKTIISLKIKFDNA